MEIAFYLTTSSMLLYLFQSISTVLMNSDLLHSLWYDWLKNERPRSQSRQSQSALLVDATLSTSKVSLTPPPDVVQTAPAEPDQSMQV